MKRQNSARIVTFVTGGTILSVTIVQAKDQTDVHHVMDRDLVFCRFRSHERRIQSMFFHNSIVDSKKTVEQLFNKLEASARSNLFSAMMLSREILELIANELFSLKFNTRNEQFELGKKIQMLDEHRAVPAVISVHMNLVLMLTDENVANGDNGVNSLIEPCVASTRVIAEWYKY